MTRPPPREPSWDEVEAFARADRWRHNRESGHAQWEKLLPGGVLLQLPMSRGGDKTMSPGRFRQILRDQLKVTREQFWDAIRTGEPVDRSAPTEEPTVQHPVWVMSVLVNDLHMSAAEIEALSPEEAEALVHEHWGRPSE